VSIVRLGGICLVIYVPLLLAGVALYGRVGINSQLDGATALRRIADAGGSFPIMNALFHLGALLLIPAAIALGTSLRSAESDPYIQVGTGFVLLAAVVGAGFVFSLNQGLAVTAGLFDAADEAGRGGYAAAADMNLSTQRGAELVQSLGLGLWLLAIAAATAGAGWPGGLVLLGAGAGLGFIAAGLSSVLLPVPVIGVGLAIIGTLGLLLFVAWDLATGLRLLTTPI
jgi:hypothetical protein